jgi:RNA polymerase sigma-70 factor (sigma-E family)
VVAFEDFVAARGNGLLRLAFLLTLDRHSAEELTQAALARAFERWGRVTSADQPDAYVRRLMINTFIDGRRRRRERPVDPNDHALEAATVSDFADAVVAREQMWNALAHLPRRQRAVLVLRYYEGYDDALIAGVLNCTASTVRSNACRGLATLRVSWSQDGDLGDHNTTSPAPTHGGSNARRRA